MASGAIVHLEQTQGGFSAEQIDIIKSQITPQGTTNEELRLFLLYCQRTGLDPFARQIYLSERRTEDKQTRQWITKRMPETTIDGFRVIAERSGLYAGQVGPFWCGEDGEWKDVWLGKDLPSAAKVGILRKDFKEPVWGVALFQEYVQTTKEGRPNHMWSKMGANQLAKCAESLGLRKAFPRDLSGLYTREEMAQSSKAEELAEAGGVDTGGHDVGTKAASAHVAQDKIRLLTQARDSASSTAEEGGSEQGNPEPSFKASDEDLPQVLRPQAVSESGIPEVDAIWKEMGTDPKAIKAAVERFRDWMWEERGEEGTKLHAVIVAQFRKDARGGDVNAYAKRLVRELWTTWQKMKQENRELQPQGQYPD